MDPLFSDTDSRGQNLRLLLGSICLRRDKAHINIPTGDEHTVTVELSDDERALHSRLLKDYRELMDTLASKKSTIKRYATLFTTILQLRRLCNHGTFQNNPELVPGGMEDDLAQSDSPTSKDLDHQDCNFCDMKVSQSGGKQDITTCTLCSETLCLACMDGHESRCQSSLLASSWNAGLELPSQISVPKQPNLLPHGHSSKLLAVVVEIQACIGVAKR